MLDPVFTTSLLKITFFFPPPQAGSLSLFSLLIGIHDPEDVRGDVAQMVGRALSMREAGIDTLLLHILIYVFEM